MAASPEADEVLGFGGLSYPNGVIAISPELPSPRGYPG